MLRFASVTFALASLLLSPVLADTGYSVVETYDSTNFFDKVNFFTNSTSGDPTHGFVHYVDRSTAEQMKIINTDNNQVYLGVDYTNQYSDTGNPNGGRPSVRVSTQKSFHQGLFVLDLAHMPKPVCGSWPAFWSFGPNWPYDGEIDIIENVNTQDFNGVTLHTSPGCKMNEDPSTFSGSGSIVSTDCNTAVNGNQGCSVADHDSQAYGNGFNGNGGGYYVTEWTSDIIQVWFFTHDGKPADLDSAHPSPSSWGKTPIATFKTNSNCNINDKFNPQNFVFDITFCGDWAGNADVFGQQCPGKGKCVDWVGQNPGEFQDVNWQINSFKVYQIGDITDVPPAGGSGTTTTDTSTSTTDTSTSTTDTSTSTTDISTTTTDTTTSTTDTSTTTADSSTSTTDSTTTTGSADSAPTDSSTTTTSSTDAAPAGSSPTSTDSAADAPAGSSTTSSGAADEAPAGTSTTTFTDSSNPTTTTVTDTTVTTTPLAVSPINAVAVIPDAASHVHVTTTTVKTTTTVCCYHKTNTPKLVKKEAAHHGHAHGHIHEHRH